MPKTSKDKIQVADKSYSIQSSSNQKENRPRKLNISKQPMMKSAKKTRSKRKPVRAMRAMPSLADLEKMFEDSEEDMDQINSTGPSHNLSTFNLPQEPSNTSKIHANTEPVTLNKTSCSSHAEVKFLSPARKRVKLDTEYSDDELPPIIISPSKKCSKSSSSILTENEQIETCHNNIKSDNFPAGEKEEPIHNNEYVSENRTDSNKTIDYNLDITALQNKTLSESFSPKPCSSTDIKQISINDKLFAKTIQLKNSIYQINGTQKPTTTQIVESSTPPVISVDDLIVDYPIDTEQTKERQKLVQVVEDSTSSEIIDDIPSKELSTSMVQTNETQNLSQTVKSSTSFVIIDDSVIEEPVLNTVQTNRTKNLTQAAQSSMPTVVIDNSLIEEAPIPQIDNDIEIIESDSTQMNSTNTIETSDNNRNNNDDDDCVFVEASPNTISAVPKEPEVIDLDYSSVQFECESYGKKPQHKENEVIDVDAIIALNRSILDKYKSVSSNNLVIDVDNTFVEPTSNQNIQNRNENEPVPNDSGSSQNMQSQPQKINQNNNLCSNTGQECEVIETSSDIQAIPTTSKLLPTNGNHTRDSRAKRQTQLIYDITVFFKKNRQNQTTDHHHNSQQPSTQQPSTPINALLQILGLNTIDVPNRTTLNRQTSTVRLNKQAITPQSTQTNISKNSTVTSNSQKTKATPNNISNNGVPLSPLKNYEKGNIGDCPICMDRLSSKEIASTICGHIFCFSCIQTAIKSNKRCPTCRKLLKNNGFHKIFL